MDHVELVDGREAYGNRIIDALEDASFPVEFAFWGKASDDKRWYLYLTSSAVVAHGLAKAYRIVNGILDNLPYRLVDRFEPRLLKPGDSPADDAAAKLKPRIPNGPFARQNPKPYPGMTVLYDTTLGGYEFDEVEIYPPRQPQSTP
ncbi:MAG: hypothetical protein SGJ19_15670 [Planctomycetia bacterium]|nr:hypothetical protein [Planctomycetia bacterium]